MRQRAAVALIAGAFAAAVPASAQTPTSVGLEVYFPLDGIVVEDSDLAIEGRFTGLDPGGLTWSVNGERDEVLFVRDTFFAEEASLEEGPNTVRVGDATFSVWLATEDRPPPPRYRRVYGHAGLADGCAECHEVDRDGVLGLVTERTELCGWCHGDLVRGLRGEDWASVHEPVKRGECLRCHAPHLSLVPGLPAAQPPACSACHAEVEERLSSDRFVHGPMNLGDCRLCHLVHASEQPGLLTRPATSLCTDCHSDAVPPPDAPAERRPHRMIPEGRCGTCHEPHSSPNPKFLRQPAARLCLECHEGKTRSFHEAKGFSIYVCAKCHDLHRPTREHLLADTSRSLCLQCHDYRGAAAFTHSFVREGECFRCHAFHEAPLGRDVALTCLGCHRGNPRLPEAHGGVPFSRSRCTSCHRPHQSDGVKLLRRYEHPPFEERVCDACHVRRADLVTRPWRPLCLDCHTELDLAAQPEPPAEVHPPFLDGDCADCHESHDSRDAGLLRRPPVLLCLECHRALRKAFLIEPDSAHDAFLEGRCVSCHEPHAGGERGLLRAPWTTLCAGCHEDLLSAGAGQPWPYPHEPVAEGKCKFCHQPHTSGNAALLKSRPPQPCRPCHAEFFRGLAGREARVGHPPVREGRCEACHAIHGGERARLLRDSPTAVCLACHGTVAGVHHEFEAAALESKPAGAGAAERGCVHCHLPHAAAEPRLLPRITVPVCAGCHRI